MRVVNQGGYLHDHITDLRLEEDCNLHGRKKIFHRIWGYDADRQYEIVLDWGIDREEVKDCFQLMQRQLRRGAAGYWNCPRYGLAKEKQEEKKNECSTAGREAC